MTLGRFSVVGFPPPITTFSHCKLSHIIQDPIQMVLGLPLHPGTEWFTQPVIPHTSKWRHTGSSVQQHVWAPPLTCSKYPWYQNEYLCLINQCRANLIFSFPANPLALVHPSVKWAHHCACSARQGRALTHSSSGWFSHQSLGDPKPGHTLSGLQIPCVSSGDDDTFSDSQFHQDSWEHLSS